MEIKQICSQKFGMALECKPDSGTVREYITKRCRSEHTGELLRQLMSNKALTILELENSGKKTKLCAIVGDEMFREGFFTSPYRVLKKALNKSIEQSNIELIAETLTNIFKDID